MWKKCVKEMEELRAGGLGGEWVGVKCITLGVGKGTQECSRKQKKSNKKANRKDSI